MAELSSGGPGGPTEADALNDFAEALVTPAAERHAFLSSEYEGNRDRNAIARQVIEAVGTLPCHWGKDYAEADVAGQIRDALVAAQFVVADLTAPSADGRAVHANLNAAIEAGIAWGAGRRLYCFAAADRSAPAAGAAGGKTRHLPFMFRNYQIDLYADDDPFLAPGAHFLGAVHRVVVKDRDKFGRRIINHELAAPVE